MEERRLLAMPAALAGRVQAEPETRALRGLRAWRERQGVTQAELALRTGLPMSLLGQLESRDHAPSPRTWALLAGALGVPASWLLSPP